MKSRTHSPTEPHHSQPVIARLLFRYRVMAYFTGTCLLLLTAEVIAKYIFRVENLPNWIAIVHGWAYLLYILVAFDLGTKLRWPRRRIVGTLLAGTVPFVSFVIERKRTMQVQRAMQR